MLRKEHEEEWEPDGALTSALEETSLLPGAPRDEHLAGLVPHLEKALAALGRLERQRGLSGGERMRMEALGMLLDSIERAEQ